MSSVHQQILEGSIGIFGSSVLLLVIALCILRFSQDPDAAAVARRVGTLITVVLVVMGSTFFGLREFSGWGLLGTWICAFLSVVAASAASAKDRAEVRQYNDQVEA